MNEEFPHIPDSRLYDEWQHGMEGIDQTYIEWLESELKSARAFKDHYDRWNQKALESQNDPINPEASIEAWEWWKAQEAHGNDCEDDAS